MDMPADVASTRPARRTNNNRCPPRRVPRTRQKQPAWPAVTCAGRRPAASSAATSDEPADRRQRRGRHADLE